MHKRLMNIIILRILVARMGCHKTQSVTFSPAKMWIHGLQQLKKPLLHLHTQFNKEIPWDTMDMVPRSDFTGKKVHRESDL